MAYLSQDYYRIYRKIKKNSRELSIFNIDIVFFDAKKDNCLLHLRHRGRYSYDIDYSQVILTVYTFNVM